jgi:hypothetical protein
MKIKKEHFEYIKNAIVPMDTIEAREYYKSEGLSTIRYQWDCFWRANLSTWVCDNVYTYGCNDSHIYTVINKIIPSL